jgi:protein-disulfide isomerase
MSLKKMSVLLGVLLIASMVLTACPAPQAPAAPQVVTSVVTQVVKEEVQVEVTKVVTGNYLPILRAMC